MKTFAFLFAVLLNTSAWAVENSAIPPLLGSLNGPSYLISIDRTTVVGTRIGPFGNINNGAMTSLEYDGLHRVLYGATSADVPSLFRINPATGAATPVGVPGSLGFLSTGMAHDSIADVLYAAGGDRFFRKNLYAVNRTTGVGTLLGPVSGIVGSIQGLAFDRATNTLYALDDFFEANQSGGRIVKIDWSVRAAIPVTENLGPTLNGWNGLAFDPVTRSLFASSNLFLHQINPSTGAFVNRGLLLSPEAHTVGGMTVMANVPEPAAIVQVGTAVAAAGLATSRIRPRRLSANAT